MSEPKPTPVKPGYKTTEFWLTVVADIVGLVLMSGAVEETGTISRIVGGAVAVLATLGYSAARSKTKSNP